MNSKIIRAGAGAGPRVVKGEAYDAALEAERIVEAAHAQAREILEAAGQARQEVFEAARREGYEHGLDEWNAAIAEARAARDRRLAESESDLVRLAVRIAGKIIGAELRANPEAIAGIVRESLQGLRRERSLMLRVPAADIDLLRRRIDLLREAAGPHRSLEVVADPSVPPGGCIVESEYGVIDARLETQLRSMEQILLRAASK